eukprot:5802669-Heterocapsa_arctica.AAC.1
MVLVEDLGKHQLDKGVKHLQAKTIDLLNALGDRYKPVEGRKTGAKITAIDPSAYSTRTLTLPPRRRKSGGGAE